MIKINAEEALVKNPANTNNPAINSVHAVRYAEKKRKRDFELCEISDNLFDVMNFSPSALDKNNPNCNANKKKENVVEFKGFHL